MLNQATIEMSAEEAQAKAVFVQSANKIWESDEGSGGAISSAGFRDLWRIIDRESAFTNLMTQRSTASSLHGNQPIIERTLQRGYCDFEKVIVVSAWFEID